MSGIVIRAATLADVPALVMIEREAWPDGMAADEAQILARIAAFPVGQLVAERDGEIVGVVWSQRIDAHQLSHEPLRYHELTDGGRFTASHRDDGNVFQLIGVAVGSQARHLRLGRRLVDAAIALAKQLPAVSRILGFTRPLGYHNQAHRSIEDYAAQLDRHGRPVDPMLAFHLTAGARLVSFHADFRPEDREALGYGAWIEYPR